MESLRSLKRLGERLRNLATRQSRDRRLREEMEEHLALQTEENIRRGMSPAEARRQAALRFGPVQAIRESYHAEEVLPPVETVLQDCRFALRMLRKSPMFSMVALFTLALGIGANTAIFSLVDAFYLKPLPVPHADQIVHLYARGPSGHYGAGFSIPEDRALRDRASTFSALAAATRVAQSHRVPASASAGIAAACVSSNHSAVM